MPPENPIRDSWLRGFENGLIVGGLRVGAGWSFLENGRRGAIRRIRVAQGTYKPDENEGGNVILGDRGATFTMANGVHVSGGYRGLSGGGEPDDHDHDAFVTILSGDI
ncbi:MAG: hypothetical protein IID37_16245, partial [Planctomycetes bacterium]|nr:hypothetical protein [Planctomycetota bacterium]